ncbi:MAG: ferredoxin [Dehalococcoidia bacterium]|nr:ferredoxin [Dehalococcoidia bacterium]
MKVVVDPDKCEGHSKCEKTAPAVFKVENDLSVVLVDEVPAEEVDNVERAIRLCPRQAISWGSR